MSKLFLQNFRSFKSQEFLIADQTILIGPNGSGKTNILESLFFLATSTSFRTKNLIHLITLGQDFARVEFKDIAIVLQKEQKGALKNYFISGKKTPLLKAIGRLKVILFSPEMLNILSGSPAERRRFINISISQLSKIYPKILTKYAEVLKRRNALLSLIKEGQASQSELEFWDQELVNVGIEIIQKRDLYISKLNNEIELIAEAFFRKKLKIVYETSVQDKEDYFNKLLTNRPKEINYTHTMTGPHRDDFKFILNEKDLISFGSRGEWRISIIIYLFALYNLFLKEGEAGKPICLFDDLYSELDTENASLVEEFVKDKNFIITTTFLPKTSSQVFSNVSYIKLNAQRYKNPTSK